MDFEKIKSVNWYNKSLENLFSLLSTSLTGLSSGDASERLARFGPNELQEEKKVHPIFLLLEQFKSLLIWILIIAAVISIVNGKAVEAIAIIVIVLLAGILGFIQEFKAGKAIESLRKMAAPQAHVIRDGKEIVVNTSELVPGDLVVIKMGDRIPADSRLIESVNLKIDEAPLTGESLPVEKHTEELDGENIPLGDRKNMVYMGTAVSYGRGKAVVVSTGMGTEFGKIANMLQSAESRKTPLQHNLDQLGKKIGIFAIVLAAIMSVAGILKGHELTEMFLWGVALAIAVIPEALPAVVTISLALGVRRMVSRRALIRKLPAVETLGATTIICSDKTGTLTQDEMTIRKVYTGGKLYTVSGSGYNPVGEFVTGECKVDPKGEDILNEMLIGGSLCNDTNLTKDEEGWDILGDPTEGAIIVTAKKAGLDYKELQAKYPRIHEIPFTSERKRMTTVHTMESGNVSFSKGATEVILDSCEFVKENGETIPLTAEKRKEILDIAYNMANEALRVLAVSEKHVGDDYKEENSDESGMTFLGLVGMIDPPRPEVKEAIKVCEHAGIKPVMITGDHKITAVAIARELGILKEGRGALSGQELEQLSDEEFEKVVDKTDVYARISPGHKLKIVEGLMKKGNVVAMTGDGVNDAPSLKKADIGVAMGITGTDVSKEAADMILTDDNFTSIVEAVEEGRGIFENIRKYLVYLLSGNIGKVLGIVMALLIGLDIPLQAVQILFLNFLMDGLMAIALGVEPPEPGIMNRKPRNVKEGILNRFTLWWISGVGILIGIASTAVYYWALAAGYPQGEAVTIFFLTIVFVRLLNGFNCRSLDTTIFKMKFFGNMSLIYSSIGVLVLTGIVMAVPFLREAFKVTLLDASEWIATLGAAVGIFLMVEILKVIKAKLLLNK